MVFLVVFGFQTGKVAEAVTIISPTNRTYSPGVLELSVSEGGLGGGSNIHYSMTYTLDGKGNVSIPSAIQYFDNSFQVMVNGSVFLPVLPEGPHNVTVYEETFWDITPPWTFSDNATVYFTVDDGKAPVTTFLSAENQTCSQNSFSLNFTVDELTSWIGYCLDGQGNVTVAGNTTLTGLSYQEHNVTVYARDLAGNVGASKTINFTISQPETLPTPSPKPFPTTAIVVGSAAIGVIVVAVTGLLVYLRKRHPHAFLPIRLL